MSRTHLVHCAIEWKVEGLTSKGKLPSWKGIHGCAYSGSSAPDGGRGPCPPCLLHSLLLCTLHDSSREGVLARLCALNHCSTLPRRWSGEAGEERFGFVPPAAPNFTWEMVPLQTGRESKVLGSHDFNPGWTSQETLSTYSNENFWLFSSYFSYIKLSLLTVFSPQIFS